MNKSDLLQQERIKEFQERSEGTVVNATSNGGGGGPTPLPEASENKQLKDKFEELKLSPVAKKESGVQKGLAQTQGEIQGQRRVSLLVPLGPSDTMSQMSINRLLLHQSTEQSAIQPEKASHSEIYETASSKEGIKEKEQENKAPHGATVVVQKPVLESKPQKELEKTESFLLKMPYSQSVQQINKELNQSERKTNSHLASFPTEAHARKSTKHLSNGREHSTMNFENHPTLLNMNNNNEI